MKKNLITLIFFLLSSLSYGSSQRVDFQYEIELYVKKLNSLFGIEVKTIKAREDFCTFASGRFENNWTIIYCPQDFPLFENPADKNNGLNKLLTLIGHEYSHVLLDMTMSPEAIAVYTQSVKEAAQAIESDIINDPKKIEQLKSVVIEKPHLIDSIIDFISLIHHENIDALGVKITEMAKYKADPYWPILGPYFVSAPEWPEFNLWIAPRIDNMREAQIEGLNGWQNFNCLSNAFTFQDSNLILREGFARFGETGLIHDLDMGCSVEEVVKTFYRKLNSYAPKKSPR